MSKQRDRTSIQRGAAHVSRPRLSERERRVPATVWDRIKFVILLLGLWACGLAIVWTTTVNPIGGPFSDALRIAFHDYSWILVLLGIEVLRQLHYLIEEHSKAYYRFWQKTVFGRATHRLGKMDDWTRFRAARAFKAFIFLLALSTFLGRLFKTDPVWFGLLDAPGRLVTALPFVFQLSFGFLFIIVQFGGLFWFLSRGGIDTYMPDDLETRFSDVKGQDPVLERVQENMIFLDDPESIEDRGGYVPGGLLLWGPPGTGKTLMAQAVAGETAKPFVFVDPGAFTQMFMGVGILKVKSLYRKLRKLAVRYGGVIVFFDEADSLGNRGSLGTQGGGWNFGASGGSALDPGCNGMAYLAPVSRDAIVRSEMGTAKDPIFMGGMGGGGGMGTLQALLSAMSGLKKPRGFINRYVRRLLGMKPKPPPKYRILHIFATNMPQALDEAMLRPGRIDRIYKVGYPSKEGRKSTYDYYLGKVQHELTPADIDKLATMTPYATGASIQDLVNEALVIAIRDGREVINWADVTRAKQLKEHGLPDDSEYVNRERHAVAIHEACHAVAAYRTRRHMVIDMATIERRGDIGGFVSSIPPEDQFVQWRSERDADIIVSLASLAGERLFFDGDNSAGVGGDLRGATAIAALMLGYWAMGDTVASHGVSKLAISGTSAGSAEDGIDRNFLESDLGKRVERKLQEMLEVTAQLLRENRNEVLAVAHALETHKTVSGDDVEAIIEGRQGPLVDGRPYKDTGFAEEMERYHEAALEAHREHARVDLSMPVPALAGSTPPNGQGNGHVRLQEGLPRRPDVDQD
ncbi:MAG: AAA family ATPase [Actinomycetota bacterium]